jgi:WD40 repeat protein
VIETGDDAAIFSVAFNSDGMQLFGGNNDGVRRWRVADGQEVRNQMAMDVNAISVSTDGQWMVCGSRKGASVWDAKTQENTIEVDGTDMVGAVDISPESTSFATAAGRGSGYKASIWNIITGERLVGPLQHNGFITGIKFSPNGEHIATAVRDRSIRVFDSRDGDQLIAIKTDMPSWWPSIPLAWSNDGHQLFAAASDRKIKSFDVSTGSQVAELQVHGDNEVVSIALAANGKFLATFVGYAISFWDTSTLTQIGPVIKDSHWIRSISLSPDSGCLATGGDCGNITVRNVNIVLPDFYGPFSVSTHAFTFLSDESHIVLPS